MARHPSDSDYLDLLGGAERKRTRPRGFVDWAPKADAVLLLGQVQAVLDEYSAYLPLTVRQIFYRLVGAHGYEKNELAYDRLKNMMTRARRARRISMDDIRDDGGQQIEPNEYSDADHFLRTMKYTAENFRLKRQEGQNTQLVVMCEAGGMAPQLANAVDEYGITVYSSGGFESVTEKHRFASEISDAASLVEVLHIGDHDPSGVHLYYALAEDVQAFAEEYDVHVTFTRLAVTPDQIEEMHLDTAPPKKSDPRAFTGETCQAEAIPPDVLREILIDAVEARIDEGIRQGVIRREKRVRTELIKRFK